MLEPLKLDRVHRISRYSVHRSENPRDVIVRFHYAEEKSRIMEKTRNLPGLSYEGAELQVYSDLSAETLTRRVLRPLRELLKSSGISYQWGFPACLVGEKNGRTAVLRFPEDFGDFCGRLDIQPPFIPGWGEAKGPVAPQERMRWRKGGDKGRGTN